MNIYKLFILFRLRARSGDPDVGVLLPLHHLGVGGRSSLLRPCQVPRSSPPTATYITSVLEDLNYELNPFHDPTSQFVSDPNHTFFGTAIRLFLSQGKGLPFSSTYRGCEMRNSNPGPLLRLSSGVSQTRSRYPPLLIFKSTNNRRKKVLDVDDVKMAVQMQCEQNNTAQPSREVLLELSQSRYRYRYCRRGYQLI